MMYFWLILTIPLLIPAMIAGIFATYDAALRNSAEPQAAKQIVHGPRKAP